MKNIYLALLLCTLTACSPDRNSNHDAANEVDNKITDLQAQMAKLENEIQQLSEKVTDLKLQDANFAVFTPSSTRAGYETVHSNVGNFIVSLDKLTRYVNGYKATFLIGNPNAMLLDGLTAKLNWGTNYTEEVKINRRIIPGTWNKVEVILSPATPDDVAAIALSLEGDNIKLYSDFRPIN